MPMLCVRDFEVEARQRLDPAVYDFYAGGADDEVTLRANETAFTRIGLLPRVLRGAGMPELGLYLLGCDVALPVLIAPTAFQRLAHLEGECATARAAAHCNTIMIVSMAATVAIEEVCAAGSRGDLSTESACWLQLYIQPDLGFTEAIVRRAEAAGCKALVVSVDSPTFGRRERDLRHGFASLPDGMFCENLREPRRSEQPGRVRSIVFSPELSWTHVEWLRKLTTLPILLKGVVRPDDARLAIERGVDGLVVSNHGGRQLDTVPPAIDLLPAIAHTVAGRVPIVLDGGVRRGTDIVKAVALGASAVAIGRPVLWALAVSGSEGVVQLLQLLQSELEHALILCGCGRLSDLDRSFVRALHSEMG